MGSFSNYLENKVLDHVTGKADLASLDNDVHIALCTGAYVEATVDGLTGITMPEVGDANAYARVTLDTGTVWDAATAGATANVAAIAFPAATGDWGTVTYFAALDSDTHGAGNILFHGALTVSKAVTDGDTVEFAIGDLDITLT